MPHVNQEKWGRALSSRAVMPDPEHHKLLSLAVLLSRRGSALRSNSSPRQELVVLRPVHVLHLSHIRLADRATARHGTAASAPKRGPQKNSNSKKHCRGQIHDKNPQFSSSSSEILSGRATRPGKLDNPPHNHKPIPDKHLRSFNRAVNTEEYLIFPKLLAGVYV